MDGQPRPRFNPFSESPAAGRNFVGRQNQLSQVDRSIAATIDRGLTRHLYVVGEAGTGKTSFLAKCVERAREAGLATATPTVDLLGPREQVAHIILSILNAL